MKRGLGYILYILVVIGLSTCKTPYNPAPITAVTNYLVVEGFINISDSTYITLSRTVNVSVKTTVKPELKATITIESNTGNSYPLKELGNGVYASAALALSAANQYHLRIKTTNGSTYASDFVPARVSPPIDSISWTAKGNSLGIYANTHDPQNATRYYRWDFTEGWEFHSYYDSHLISNGLQVSYRTPAQQIWDCFGSDASTNISLGTSVQLSSDVISRQLITTIASSSEKLGIKYSIQLKQYSLTKDAYDYWTLLKKNTEELGSIFDAQPSVSIGNIHNINVPSEPVIGYICAGTVTTSRIFITKGQLPNWVTIPVYGPSVCEPPDTLNDPNGNHDPSWRPPSTNQYVNWLSPDYVNGPVPLVAIDIFMLDHSTIPTHLIPTNTNPTTASIPVCVDCTLRGKNTPPSYWK